LSVSSPSDSPEPLKQDAPVPCEPDFLLSPRFKRLNTYLTGFLVYLTLFGIVLGISWHDRAFRGEFGDHPDEAAHYVTGLMFHDYIIGVHYFQPIRFAENFYMHYPKVALGHWPPFFYMVEGAWTLLFPASLGSLMYLMAALTALLGTIVYHMLTNSFDRPLALAAALALIALPIVQNYTTLVMAEIPLAVSSLAAAIFFGRFVEEERFEDALWFGALASLAILTKGGALALGLLPPIAILLTRKWHLLGKLSLWLSAALVMAVCGPWYWMTRHMQNGTWMQPAPTLSYALSAGRFYSSHFFIILGWPLACLAVIGVFASVVRLIAFPGRNGFWVAMIGLLLGFTVVACVIPVGKEERYLLPAVPAALALSVAGLGFLGSKLPYMRTKPALLGLIFLCIFLVTAFHFRRERNYGFASLAQLLTSSPQFRDEVILIASDADGEGMLVSEIAMRERRPGHIVLRASKILTTSDWTGVQLTPRFRTPEQVQDYVDSIPVSVVILDHSVSSSDFQDYEDLLERAVVSHERHWALLGTYSVWRGGVEHRAAAKVYLRSARAAKPQGVVHIDMTNMLGKTLTLQIRSGDSN
jgi:dolichyl-phosphate-mannose-protein mannosyltransferase